MIRALLFAAAASFAIAAQAPEPCETDEECILLCPPADAECDGGPYIGP